MKVLYLIQTHKNPEQIYRLVQIIRKSSLESHIVVIHDFSSCDLDIAPLQNLPEVEVLRLNGKGGRGDFSMIQGYLDSLDWLFSHNLDFDWLINITGQDYPTQPLSKIEKFLAETKYDGFLEYFEALSNSKSNPWGVKEGGDRYLYKYWRSGVRIPLFDYGHTLPGRILNRLGAIFNNAQPFIRICWAFDGLMIGLPANYPFDKKFICYGGSYFHTISRKCVQFLYDFTKENSNIVEYYKQTCVPVESFVQTVLLNSKLFNLCNDPKRYFDFYNSQNGSPRVLTVEDYPKLVHEDIHFARKFELEQDSTILDMLDIRILEKS